MVLAKVGRLLKNLPKDLAAAIKAGRVPGAVVSTFLELEKLLVLRWLMQFGGFKERLMADDIFLTKVVEEFAQGLGGGDQGRESPRRSGVDVFGVGEVAGAAVVDAIRWVQGEADG
nr:protein reticulata-related 4, chloroplastic [Quercus suber]